MTNCLEFLRLMLRTPSLSGEEGELAQLVFDEMERLGYDRVFRDEIGNIVGLYRGSGDAPPMMLNTHLDHVGVGDWGRWPFPPFQGTDHQGKIWGRGAVDIKGPLAAQLYGVAALIQEGIRPPGDVYVTAVVFEEVGGLGARHLSSHLKPELVIVGEPSGNQVRYGHRGRTEVILYVQGKSVHASIPAQGVNPLEVMARVILGLEQLEMASDSVLGPATVAPTLIRTDQSSPNVIPSEAWLTLDWRNVPMETPEGIRRKVLHLAQQSCIEGAEADVAIPAVTLTSYTGWEQQAVASHPAYVLAPGHPAVLSAVAVLEGALDRSQHPTIWRFATDGGHFAQAGMTVVGFGPGDETLAHTVEESIGRDEVLDAVRAYRSLALHWARQYQAAE